MIPKKEQEENRRVLAKISMEKPHYEVIYRVRTAPRKIKWVKEEGTGVYSEAGELVALDGFLVDITDQKTAELELREENLRLKSSIRDRHGLDKLIGKSMVVREVYVNLSGILPISGGIAWLNHQEYYLPKKKESRSEKMTH